jgi:hypothetical protein
MGQRRVYISSTFKDLERVREQIIQVVTDPNILGDDYSVAYIMESMKVFGNSASALEQCLDAVRSADVYILIIGNWYGTTIAYGGEDLSYTQHEYMTAINSTNNPRIYIFHSDADYDAATKKEADELCVQRGSSPKENGERVAVFKQLTMRDRPKIDSFSSDEVLKKLIYHAFISDIKYYFLFRQMDEFRFSNAKLPYYIDRIPQNTLLKKEMFNGRFRNIYPVLLLSEADNQPRAYAKRVMYDKCYIARYDGLNNPFFKPIKWSDYQGKFTSFYKKEEKKEEKKEFKDFVEFLKRTEEGNENAIIVNLSRDLKTPGAPIKEIIQFEVGTVEQEVGNYWIKFIDEFVRSLLAAEDLLNVEAVFVFVHVLYRDKGKARGAIKLFTKDHFIDGDILENIKYADILEFFKSQVLQITADESDENGDKKEEYDKLVAALNTAIGVDQELSYYKTTKILNLKIDQ